MSEQKVLFSRPMTRLGEPRWTAEEVQRAKERRLYSHVRDWYVNAYPMDELGGEITEELTFKNVFTCLRSGRDIYDYLGVGDSIVRERVFSQLADILGKSYDCVYRLWLAK